MKYDRFHVGIICGACYSWSISFIRNSDWRGAVFMVVGTILLVLGTRNMHEENE